MPLVTRMINNDRNKCGDYKAEQEKQEEKNYPHKNRLFCFSCGYHVDACPEDRTNQETETRDTTKLLPFVAFCLAHGS